MRLHNALCIHQLVYGNSPIIVRRYTQKQFELSPAHFISIYANTQPSTVLNFFLCPGYLEAISVTAIVGDKGHHPYACEIGDMSSQAARYEAVIVSSVFVCLLPQRVLFWILIGCAYLMDGILVT